MSGVFEDAEAFLAACPFGALVGLDLGTKTIGLALCDPLRTVASPLHTLPRTKFGKDVAALEEACADRTIEGYVIGLPLNMDASAGPRAQSARAYAYNLAKKTERPVILWDERLSTVAAERALLENDTSRRRRAELIDNVAAAYILQGLLDRLSHIKGAELDG